MITGFNTDIEYEGVTYHVQTEDKGRAKPIILSLVYNGGTILASKRSPYDDLLHSNFSERVLSERLNKQHRLICAAIQAGRIEDLKKLSAREAAPTAPAVETRPRTTPETQPAFSGKVKARQGIVTPAKPLSIALDDERNDERPIPKPGAEKALESASGDLLDVPIIDAVAVIEDDIENEVLLSADAVSIIEELQTAVRPEHDKLGIEILGDARFKGGNRNTVDFMVSRGSQKKVVAGAQIMVKILGSSFRPVIFHAQTDQNGLASVNLQVPNFTAGRAVFLVRAIADGEEIEVRRSIAHG